MITTDNSHTKYPLLNDSQSPDFPAQTHLLTNGLYFGGMKDMRSKFLGFERECIWGNEGDEIEISRVWAGVYLGEWKAESGSVFEGMKSWAGVQ